MKHTEATLVAALQNALDDADTLYGEAWGEDWDTGEEERQEAEARVERTTTFDDAMLLTQNKGLIIRLDDGTEFQVTVVQSRR